VSLLVTLVVTNSLFHIWPKLLSLGFTIWGLHYWFKTQPPLDRPARIVRWVGIFSCGSITLFLFSLHSLKVLYLYAAERLCRRTASAHASITGLI
jgi:hypothetical protein